MQLLQDFCGRRVALLFHLHYVLNSSTRQLRNAASCEHELVVAVCNVNKNSIVNLNQLRKYLCA